MDSAFGFGFASPATGARVLPGFDRVCARPAADAGITVIVQGVIRQVIYLNVFPDLFACPRRQRIEFCHLVGVIPFDKGSVGAEGGLVAADAGDPGFITGKELPLWNHFAYLATGVRVAFP